MTQTINGSAYPLPVDELLPAARKLAKELGEVPSRNRLMSELRIGAPKAQALREKLLTEGQDTATREKGLRQRLVDQFGYTPPRDRAPLDPAAIDEAHRIWAQTSHISTDDHPAPHLYPAPIGPDPDPVRAQAFPNLLAAVARIREGHAAQEFRPAPHLYPGSIGPVREPSRPDPYPVGHLGTAWPVDRVQPVKVNNPAPLVTPHGHPGPAPAPARRRKTATWPVWLLALPAFVAIWSGWVGLGSLTGFGVVYPLPGIADWVRLDTAILLPVGVETYGAFALRVWMSGTVPARARRFARVSAIGSLLLGGLGQVAYHLMTAQGWTAAPWWITTLVSCLPVAVLGMGAALAHLLRDES